MAYDGAAHLVLTVHIDAVVIKSTLIILKSSPLCYTLIYLFIVWVKKEGLGLTLVPLLCYLGCFHSV